MRDLLAQERIRALNGSDAESLGAFFEALSLDAETVQFFRPHSLTAEYANTLCARVDKIADRYFVAILDEKVVGYSMLRGWEEGYIVPSFGACVHPSFRNAGLGKRLLAHAITQTKLLGAKRLRLTVFKLNQRAVALYKRFGFVFSDKNADELVGHLELM